MRELICRMFHKPWDMGHRFYDSISGEDVHRFICIKCNKDFLATSAKSTFRVPTIETEVPEWLK